MTRDFAASCDDLRRDFDASFAAAQEPVSARTVELLAIRVGGDPHAIRLTEVARVLKGKPITRLPSAHPALIGIAGFRGAIHPVFDLRRLLGYAEGGRQEWLLLAAAAPIGFVFEQLDGQLRVEEQDVERTRPLVSLRLLIDRLEAQHPR